MQSYSLPTNSYIDLTLPSANECITVPADGWLTFAFQTIPGGDIESSAGLINTTHKIGIRSNSKLYAAQVFLPVLKNDIVEISYHYMYQLIRFRFIYSVGSAPQS